VYRPKIRVFMNTFPKLPQRRAKKTSNGKRTLANNGSV